MALILDASSRRVIGYAIGRRIDARLAIEALRRAIALRDPSPGCVFHCERGAQYAAEKHRALLTKHGLVGSMSRRGNPCDNPRAESFMKTLKVEDVYVMDYKNHDEVAIGLPRLLERSIIGGVSTRYWAISAPSSSRTATPAPLTKPRPDLVRRQGRSPLRAE